jgi:hypothetical protein
MLFRPSEQKVLQLLQLTSRGASNRLCARAPQLQQKNPCFVAVVAVEELAEVMTLSQLQQGQQRQQQQQEQQRQQERKQ